MPEFVFNQNLNKDLYFEHDSCQKWTLSRNNDCYYCEKYTYVAIMYEQSATAANEGLIEIKDEYFL